MVGFMRKIAPIVALSASLGSACATPEYNRDAGACDMTEMAPEETTYRVSAFVNETHAPMTDADVREVVAYASNNLKQRANVNIELGDIIRYNDPSANARPESLDEYLEKIEEKPHGVVFFSHLHFGGGDGAFGMTPRNTGIRIEPHDGPYCVEFGPEASIADKEHIIAYNFRPINEFFVDWQNISQWYGDKSNRRAGQTLVHEVLHNQNLPGMGGLADHYDTSECIEEVGKEKMKDLESCAAKQGISLHNLTNGICPSNFRNLVKNAYVCRSTEEVKEAILRANEGKVHTIDGPQYEEAQSIESHGHLHDKSEISEEDRSGVEEFCSPF